MTDQQRIAEAIDILQPVGKDGLAQVLEWIAIELGAMRTAEEYRETLIDAYHRPTPVYINERP